MEINSPNLVVSQKKDVSGSNRDLQHLSESNDKLTTNDERKEDPNNVNVTRVVPANKQMINLNAPYRAKINERVFIHN